jgi:hypothetical protein
VQRALQLAEQALQPLGVRHPLRLIGGQLIGGLPDLLDSAVDLVGRRLLLLGSQDRLAEHRRRG